MNIIDRALEAAAVAHRHQVRKGTDIPYISHPCGVGIMLARAGCSEQVIAAGILHDTVEDTALGLQDIRQQFGDEVAAIVEGCSEPDKSLPWEARKEHTLEHIRHATREVRLVACADKLHNARTILADYEKYGDEVWARFKRGRSAQEWYYRGLVEALCDHSPDGEALPFCAEFRETVDRLFASQ